MEPVEIELELSLPSPGQGLTHDGESLWTALAQEGRVIQLDPKTGKELASIPLPEGAEPSALAWTREGDAPALWIATTNTPEIIELDPISGEERRRIRPIESGKITGLCTDGAAGPTLWFLYTEGEGESATTRAARFDSRDGEVHKKIVVSPDATGLDWDGRWLWYARTKTNRLCRVDPMFADITATLTLDFPPTSLAIAKNSIWTTQKNTPRLQKLSLPKK